MIMKADYNQRGKVLDTKKSDNAIMSAAHVNRSICTYPLRNQM
jgi:hypothetical protein